MRDEFLRAKLGGVTVPVFRLGLAGSYWPGEAAIRSGIDAGINYLFWYYWDAQMTRVLRDILPSNREKYVIATGVANVPAWYVPKAVDQCLRRVRGLVLFREQQCGDNPGCLLPVIK